MAAIDQCHSSPLQQRACADPVCCWSPLNHLSTPFPPKNTQMGRVRVRQHVNPLASQFQRPAPSVDWAQIYQDPTRPLFVVSAAGYQPPRRLLLQGRGSKQAGGLPSLHSICRTVCPGGGDLLHMWRWPHLRVCWAVCVCVCACRTWGVVRAASCCCCAGTTRGSSSHP